MLVQIHICWYSGQGISITRWRKPVPYLWNHKCVCVCCMTLSIHIKWIHMVLPHVRHFHHQVRKILYSLRTRRRCPESGRQEHSLVAEQQFKTRRKWKALRIAERYESGTHKSICSTHTSPSLPTFTLCWYITTRHFHHQVKKTLTIPVESYEGVWTVALQPSSVKELSLVWRSLV